MGANSHGAQIGCAAESRRPDRCRGRRQNEGEERRCCHERSCRTCSPQAQYVKELYKAGPGFAGGNGAAAGCRPRQRYGAQAGQEGCRSAEGGYRCSAEGEAAQRIARRRSGERQAGRSRGKLATCCAWEGRGQQQRR